MVENKITNEIVDILAHEYGWSIEYIQKLDMSEIAGLLDCIMSRKKIEHLISIVNIRRALSDERLTELNDDSDQLQQLIDMGLAKKVKEDKKE